MLKPLCPQNLHRSRPWEYANKDSLSCKTDKFVIVLSKALGGFVFPRADYKFVWIFKIRVVVFQTQAHS